MDESLIRIIEKIDLPTLQKLVGRTIYKAIKSINKGEDEYEIAKILVLKHGLLIFNQQEVRIAIVNSLSPQQALSLANLSILNSKSPTDAYRSLVRFFSGGYNGSKSKLLIDFLNLSTDYYYNKVIELRLEKEVIEAPFGQEIKTIGYPHDYQKRVKDEVMYRLTQRIEKTFFVQMPTGAGKTYTALECVSDVLRRSTITNHIEKPNESKYIVWLVDQNELAEQALQSFKKLWLLRGDRSMPIFRLFKNFEPDFRAETNGVVFAGFDKLFSILKNPDHQLYESTKHLIDKTQLLVIDEAHHSLAETYFECIEQFRIVPFIKIMGLSATPGTSDMETTQKLVELYSNDKISIRDSNWQPVANAISFLQEEGYLAKLKTKLLETGVTTSEDSAERLLNDLAANEERNRKIIEQIKLADSINESTIVFACTLDHVYALMILCKYEGIEAKYIIGDVDQADRINILEDFRSRKYNILLNLDILSTGIDLPNVNKIIITRPITSPNLISQIMGRALRGPRNGGNIENVIINVKDNLINFPNTSFLYNYFEEEWEKMI